MNTIQRIIDKFWNLTKYDDFSEKYNDTKKPRVIELSRGRPTEIDDETTTNAIHTQKYTIFSFIFKTFLSYFTRLGNLLFLIISIIMLTAESVNPFNSWITVIPLGFFYLLFIVKELVLDIRRSKNDSVQNDQIFSRKCIVEKRKEQGDDKFEKILWGDLMPGDMLWLKQDDTVPADIVFLDSNEIRDREAICFIDTYNVDGLKQKIRKKAVSQTTIQSKDHPQKMNFQERRKTLSAKVEFEQPTPEVNRFFGYFRKKTDTRTEALTSYNFIPRGSVIKTQTASGWVLGIVVYVGMDTKIMLNSRYKTIKFSHLEKVIQHFYFFMIFIVGIICMVSIIVLVAKSKNTQYLVEIDSNINSWTKIFQYIILYAQFFPLSLYGYIDIISVLNIYKIENWMKNREIKYQDQQQMNLLQSQQKIEDNDDENIDTNQISISDPNPLSNLGHIDYLLIDNSLCTGEFVIDNVMVNQKLYKWKWFQCRDKLVETNLEKYYEIQRFNNSPMMEPIKETDIANMERQASKPFSTDVQINGQKGYEDAIKIDGLKSPPQSGRQTFRGDNSSYLDNIEDRVQSRQQLPVFETIDKFKYADVPISQRNRETLQNPLKPGDIIVEQDEDHDNNNSLISNTSGLMSNLHVHNQSDQKQGLLKESDRQNNSSRPNYDNNVLLTTEQNQNTANAFLEDEVETRPAKKSFLPQTSLAGLTLNQKENNEDKFIDTLKNVTDKLIETDESSQEFYLDWLLTGVMLCHEAVEMSMQENEKEYWSIRKEEEVILRFANMCGYQFLSRPTYKQYVQHYQSKVRGKNKDFKVLGLNNSTANKPRVSVIVQEEPQLNQKETSSKKHSKLPIIMFCKGDIQNMTDPSILKIRTDERNNLKELKNDFESHSIRPIVYGYKELTIQEADEYHKEYMRLKNHPNSQQKKLEDLAIKMEKDFHILGVIGLKDELIPGAKEFVKFTQNTNINTWMLTGDTSHATINAAQNLHIINLNNQEQLPFEIEAQTYDDVSDQIKKILAEMKFNLCPEQEQDYDQPALMPRKTSQSQSPKQAKFFDQSSPAFKYNNYNTDSFKALVGSQNSQKQIKLKHIDVKHKDQHNLGQNKMEDTLNTFKWCLKLNGQSFSIIQKDEYLLQHFTFIINFCKHVIAYQLNPKQKAFIATLAKEHFMFNPTLCTIGDGFNDTLMMQASDISFEIKKTWMQRTLTEDGSVLKNKTKAVVINAGDIIVENLDQIQKIIIEQGLQIFTRFENVIFYMFYQQILLMVSIFCFNWYSMFLGSSLFESNLVFLFNFAFNFTSFIALGMYDIPLNQMVIQNLPGLYISGQKEKNNIHFNFLLKVVLEAIMQGVIIFYITIYGVAHSTQPDGSKVDYGILQLQIFFTIMIICNFRAMFTMIARGCYGGILTSIFNFALVFLYVYFNNNSDDKLFDKFDTWEHCKRIFNSWECILSLAYNIIICMGLSYLLRGFIGYYLKPNVIQQWQQIRLQFQSQEQILKQNAIILSESFQRYLNIGQLIKKIFKNSFGIDTSIQEMLNTGDINLAEMRLKQFSLKMLNSRLESQYKYMKLEASVKNFQIIYLISFTLFLIWQIVAEVLNVDNDGNDKNNNDDKTEQGIKITTWVIVGLFFLSLIWTNTKYFKYNYYKWAPLFLSIAVIAMMTLSWFTENLNVSLTSALVTVITTFYFNLMFINTLIINVINPLNFMIRIIYLYYYKNWDEEKGQKEDLLQFHSIASYFILLSFITIYSVYIIYRTEKQKRADFISKDQIQQEKSKAKEISSILLPKFVSDMISNRSLQMEVENPLVGILFCYIKEFPDINRSEKMKVVQHLDEMYRKFDELCIQFGVQKYETQGPSYLAVAGIKQCEVDIPQKLKNTDKCVRLINMAFAMQEVANGMKWGSGNKPFKLKIGINEGEVIAGIIGYNKKQFCLVGDAVNIAQRTTSKGEGDINVKDNVYEQIKNFPNDWYFDKRMVTMQGVPHPVGVYIVSNRPSEKMIRANKNFHRIIERVKYLKEKSKMPKLISQDQKRKNLRKKTQKGFRIDQQQLEKFQQQQKEQEEEKKQEALNKPPTKATTFKTKTFNKSMTRYTSTKTMKSHGKSPSNLMASRFNDFDDIDEIYSDEEQDDTDYKDREFQNYELTTNTLQTLTMKSQNFNQEIMDDLKKEYLSWLKDISQFEGKVMLTLLIVVYLILTLFLVTVREYITKDGELNIFWIRSVFVVLLVISVSTYGNAFLSNKYQALVFFTFLFGSFPSLLQAYQSQDQDDLETIKNEFPSIQLLEQALIFVTVSNLQVISFSQMIVILFIQNIVFFLLYGHKEWLYLDFIIFWIGVNIFIMMKKHAQITQNVQNFNTLRYKEMSRKDQDKYVSQLMPQHVILRMKNVNSLSENKLSIVDQFDYVSVLQADIKGFTAYSNEKKNPRQCVQLLQRLYEGFDKLCMKYDVFKLYTVGDCYVVLGFTNANNRGPGTYQKEAVNLTLMGLEMLDVIASVRKEVNFDALGMRVGIHTGTIVGGIIGTEVVRYDIYGKDAYITTLMESEGFEEVMQDGEPFRKVNQLHVSEKTKEMLQKGGKNTQFNFRQHLDLDGKEVEIDLSKYTKDQPDEQQTMKGYFVTKV